jgi:hypothetical protein
MTASIQTVAIAAGEDHNRARQDGRQCSGFLDQSAPDARLQRLDSSQSESLHPVKLQRERWTPLPLVAGNGVYSL